MTTTLNPEVPALAGIMADRAASAAAKASAVARLRQIARADAEPGKDPIKEARAALQAILDDRESSDDKKRAAKKALAALDAKPDDDDKKPPVGRAASATEIAAAVSLALKPAPDFAQLTREHQARVNASYRARLTPTQRDLLDRSAPRAESKTARVEGTSFVMPRRILSQAEARARLAELDAEAERG